MSYATIAQSARDTALISRIEAAAVQEAWSNATVADTEYAINVRQSEANARRMVYPVVIASDVEAAYESAVTNGVPNPGGNEAVVTDDMILANVQAKWPADSV